MRRYLTSSLPLLISALLLGASAASAESVGEYPTLKEGEWLLTMQNDMQIPGLPKGFMQDTKAIYCVDKASQDKLLQQAGKGDSPCGKPTIEKSGNTYTANVSCSQNGRDMKVHNVTTFNSEEKFTSVAEMSSTGVPPMKISSTAEFQGPCQDGRKPGDMKIMNLPGVAGGGTEIDLEQLKQMAEQMKNMQR